ncbi:carbohydrate sulfotransferase 11-like [Patiria miniata]|uniref:Carbohydrate sulfotransferase n=1 Tax=Patiria miniata TaxID=46514 RepID=A0A913ZK53_PATMI|nr:carbohydrate sulfotransferase 11-like [Patiria miniata]
MSMEWTVVAPPKSTHRRLCVILVALCFLCTLGLSLLSSGYRKPFVVRYPQRPPTALSGRQNNTVREQTRTEQNSDKPKSDSVDGQERVQLDRKRALDRVCKKHPELMKVSRIKKKTTLKSLMVMNKSKILYCVVPKVGCTNWKRVFAVLEGHRPSMNISSAQVHFNNSIQKLSSLPSSKIGQALQDYKKFFYVRHPFVRLVSFYRNKLAGSQLQWQRFARSIVQRYRNVAPSGLDSAIARGRSNSNVTWEEWIAYLTDPSNLDGFNAHWKEVYKLCSPCRVHYDFIGKLETVDSDSKYMFKLFGLHNATYPSYSRSNVSSSDLYEQYFSRVELKDLQRLWEIYKLDFELFGYPKPKELNKYIPKSGIRWRNPHKI